MFSDTSSIGEGYNFPQTSKQLAYSSNTIKPRTKIKNKQRLSAYQQEQLQIEQKTIQQNKFYFKIQVIKKVGTFLEILKQGIVFSRPNLKQSQLYYLQSQTKFNQISNLFSYDNTCIIILQTLVFILLCINIWKSSYQLVFSKLFDFPYIELFTLGIYLIYILVFLNTEIKNQKMELISNREIIFEYYYNQKMFFDICIILGLILQSTPLDSYVVMFNIFRVSTFLILKPVNEISKKLQSIMSTSTDTQIILSIMGLIFKIFLLLHTLSLLLTTLSNVQKMNGHNYTWVQTQKLDIKSDTQQYIAGWYWASTILSTVGFGDITPVNHVERAFVSFIEVLCCIMSGFFVNFIGSLINMVGQSKKIYQKDMRKVNRYLLRQQLPDGLKSGIRSHFFNKYKIDEVYDPNTQETILNKLTGHLSSQITQTRNQRILYLSKFIRPLHEITVKKLANLAKKMVFAPQQIIFSQKSVEKKLWIIEDGVVEEIPTFFNSQEDKAITIYDQQQRTLGWINFLTDKRYKTMARAKTFTLSYEIKQQDFFNVLKQNMEDYFKIQELKQNLIQKNRYYINKCLSCERFTHNVIDCPRIHFKSRGIFKILITEKKAQFLKGQQIRKKNMKRSRTRLNWKTLEGFSQVTPQIQNIINKHSINQQYYEQQRRISVDSFVHTMLRNKSSQQDSLLGKRISELEPTTSKLTPKISHADLTIQISQALMQMTTIASIANSMDRIYLGENHCYMESHNFQQINKRYVLYMINWCTNRKKN